LKPKKKRRGKEKKKCAHKSQVTAAVRKKANRDRVLKTPILLSRPWSQARETGTVFMGLGGP
jgi:hypothetical protein